MTPEPAVALETTRTGGLFYWCLFLVSLLTSRADNWSCWCLHTSSCRLQNFHAHSCFFLV